MRQIITKYDSECIKCGAALVVGQPAMYEKSTGIFCPGCEPTDTEEIRAYRQARADQKADRYKEWAGKREQKVLEWIKQGMIVHSGITGDCEVIKVNQKTAKVKGRFGNFNVSLHFLRQI